MPSSLPPRSCLIVAVLLLLVPNAGRALAQGSSLGISLMNAEYTFRPEFSARDIRIFERVLALKPEEKAAVQSLYSGYVDGLKSRSIEVKRDVDAALERAEVMQDRREMQPAQDRISEWQRQADQMKKQFLDDLKALLTREQEQRWSILERELRRAKQLGHGRLPGENIDLTRVLEDLSPPAPETKEMLDLVERYCDEMDHAIITRDDFLKAKGEDFGKLSTEDPDRALELWHEAQRLRIGVRDVNDRFVRLFATALGEKDAPAFTRKIFELRHERLMKPTRGESYVRAAAKLASLNREQSTSIAAIVDRYDRERWALLQRLAKAEEEDELTWIPPTLAKGLGKRPKDADEGFTGDSHLPKDHPIMLLRRERYDLDRGAKEQIDKILKPEQRSEIPIEREGWAQFADWTPGAL